MALSVRLMAAVPYCYYFVPGAVFGYMLGGGK